MNSFSFHLHFRTCTDFVLCASQKPLHCTGWCSRLCRLAQKHSKIRGELNLSKSLKLITGHIFVGGKISILKHSIAAQMSDSWTTRFSQVNSRPLSSGKLQAGANILYCSCSYFIRLTWHWLTNLLVKIMLLTSLTFVLLLSVIYIYRFFVSNENVCGDRP